MNCADVKNLYDRRDVSGLYAVASDTNTAEQVRHDAYWYLHMFDDGDEQAKRAVVWLLDQEMVRRAQYAAEHGGSTLHFCERQFSFDGKMAKRRWWQIRNWWQTSRYRGIAAWNRTNAMWRGSSRQRRPPFLGSGG